MKIALRSLLRNRAYATINIAGLAVGLAAALLIFLVVQYESSFDTFHAKKDQIHRVVTATKSANGIEYNAGVPFPTAAGLRLEFPQLPVVATVFQSEGQITLPASGSAVARKFKEDNIYYAEPQLFKLFDFEWLAGDAKLALTEPQSAAITKSVAEKYFGTWQNALGKTLKYDNSQDYKINGILNDLPVNTDLPLQIVFSYSSLKNAGFDKMMQDWVSMYGSHFCFIELPENISESTFNQNLNQFVKRHKPAEYQNEGMELQPLTAMHFDRHLDTFTGHVFSKDLISTLLIIGGFLLIIACVNFINLATAQAVNRAKEVGVRKVLGSSRGQLISQFLGETGVISVCALVLAICIAMAVLPLLNTLLRTHINLAVLMQPAVVAVCLGMVVIITLLAGFYPAIVLSGFNPVTALKNKLATKIAGGVSLRRGLVIFQFVIAQILIIGTLVIVGQMSYFRNTSMGFAKDAILTVPVPTDSVSLAKWNSFGNQLKQQNGIKDISFSFAGPADNRNWGSDFKYNNSTKNTDFEASLKWADQNFFNLYNLKFIAGKPYAAADTISGYVVNETLVRKLGVKPEDAIGKYIQLWNAKEKYARITGVVKDFNVTSLREEIPAVILATWKSRYQAVNVKLSGNNTKQTLTAIEALWNRNFPEYVYDSQFIDQKVERFYRHENKLSQLYKIFAGIAIFISCLGLYGLVSFMAVQRTKEVGIRRTLGASVGNIIYLFSREFTLLVIVAFAISAPVAGYFMYQWLQEYTFRIPLSPWIFISAIFGSVAIAWLTVGYKAVSAALANPVKSLRSE